MNWIASLAGLGISVMALILAFNVTRIPAEGMAIGFMLCGIFAIGCGVYFRKSR